VTVYVRSRVQTYERTTVKSAQSSEFAWSTQNQASGVQHIYAVSIKSSISSNHGVPDFIWKSISTVGQLLQEGLAGLNYKYHCVAGA